MPILNKLNPKLDFDYYSKKKITIIRLNILMGYIYSILIAVPHNNRILF